MKILITCPPMLSLLDKFLPFFNENRWVITAPTVEQTLSEEELIKLVPKHDGWIIGDDPATARVFHAGKAGRLRAAVKWGVGVDNVDFAACSDLGIPVTNTPGMFGRDVADVALGYMLALARQTLLVDRSVRNGVWLKPCGVSLTHKTVALLGMGDVGKHLMRRLLALEMHVIGYDPKALDEPVPEGVRVLEWPVEIEKADFLVVTCALTPATRHLVNDHLLTKLKRGVRIVNVSRGPIIDECALERALTAGVVHSAALDVFEEEPLPMLSPLRNHEQCVLGSHNASNTVESVLRASEAAITKLASLLRA